MEKSSYKKQVKTRSTLPKAPPVEEETTGSVPKRELVCEICGKIFKTHTQLDRHMQTEHESEEEKE